MERIPNASQTESLEALRSAVRKSETALAAMSRKGAGLTLVDKRLRALRIGLAALEEDWQGTPYAYGREELADARQTLSGLIPSVQESFEKAKAGSPQKTLLRRRIEALNAAVRKLDERT
ncbi:hypothetical protein [Saccharibacillus alkalitolerans]|uniref:CHAD domain-containing protein n=1 Tax=Saccharibacillus alkalitolerans TaxID=2705290 RepID=A0ABX0F961_9BACL|nr:hypothetical protein [Saccharibacillus alkalitolerans]NGZ76930.1 hypothetical protein [Saccharibacillus alkalitolerans]